MRQWYGVDRFVLPAVKTVSMGSTSLHCEPGESILLGMVFWSPAMSLQVAKTSWLPLHGGLTLKKKPSFLNIDNTGQVGGQWGEVVFTSPGDYL